MISRLVRAILILPGTVLVVVPALILWLARNTAFGAQPAGIDDPRFWIGLLLFCVGLVFAIWTSRLFVTLGEGTPAPMGSAAEARRARPLSARPQPDDYERSVHAGRRGSMASWLLDPFSPTHLLPAGEEKAGRPVPLATRREPAFGTLLSMPTPRIYFIMIAEP